MSFTSRIRAAVLLLAPVLAFLPAKAQLDPRLQVVNTDLLQVYQATPAKPELLTMYDFSGSMHAVYWNNQYYTNSAQSLHSAQWNNLASGDAPNGDFPGLVPAFDKNGYIWMVDGTGYYQNINAGNQPSQFQKDSSGHPTAQLVAPNGTIITINHSKTYNYTSLTTLVLQASHIRVTATYSGATRTIDLPIPWAIFDSTNTSTNNASAEIVQLTDPSGGPSVYPDTLFQHQTNNNNNVVNNPDTNFGLMKIGRFHYNMDYLWWVFFGKDVRNSTGDGVVATANYVIPDITTATTWANGLARMTRYQALKFATLSAWFANQNKVWWGARFLDGSEEQLNTVSAQNGNGSSAQADRNINLFRPALNSSSANGAVTQFADIAPSTSTPLTYAFANSYAQLAYTSDSGSSFGSSSGGGQSGTEKPIPPCRKTFFVVFTDGIANDGYTSSGSGDAIGDYDPYQKTSAGVSTLNPTLGNAAVNGYTLPALNPSYASSHSGHSMFNIWTLSGIAAHYPPPAAQLCSSGSASYSIPSIIPFAITTRGASSVAGKTRPIRTMTVGLSLAGAFADPASGKGDLYRAALYGNPDSTSWTMSDAPYDPTNPNSDPKSAPFFFDATDVNKLSQAMTAILAEVTSAAGSISAPASPLVGLSLGNQVYLGLFQTAQNNPRWQGDLLMTGLAITTDGTFFVDKNAQVTSTVTGNNAVWSVAQSVFQAYPVSGRSWKGRNLFTNYNAGTTNTTTMVPFNEATITTPATVGAPDDPTRLAYIRFMRGANSTGEVDGSTLGPRGDIMGDIIDSSPVVLEYPLSTLQANNAISPYLAQFLSANYPSTPGAGVSAAHFRVIFVGDNQGIFHAFGEVSWTTLQTVTRTIQDNSTDPPTITTTTYQANVPTAAVDELWGFLPGEFMQYIPYLRVKANPHRYMVDGTPTVYFNDANGDGVVDNGESVRVIIGERKGGRSYYAFDFSDINKVTDALHGVPMAWKLVPDNIAATDFGGQGKVFQRLGFSTPNPAIARVALNASGAPTQDMLFIGGGLSTAALDTSLSGTYGSGTKFGRSILAFDVMNGPGYSTTTWDFSSATFTSKFGAMGCIPSTVVPTDIANKGLTFRVYFADTPTDPNATSTTPRGGGLWALGNTTFFSAADAGAANTIRVDSPVISDWTGGSTAATIQGVRHVFQAPTGYSITTSPAIFLLADQPSNSLYPVTRTSAPVSRPFTVGITFGTGDRNDPVDQDNINPGSTNQNYMNVLFDRNDSAAISGVTAIHSTNLDVDGILESSDLADLTNVATYTDARITGAPAYLSQYLGYKLQMGSTVSQGSNGAYFYPKVITGSVVLSGVLFFSDFLPASNTTAACTGSGITNTYRVCDVMRPTFNGGTTNTSSTSFNGSTPNCTGIIATFPNLPGEITALSTLGILQTGQGSGKDQTIQGGGANATSGSGKPDPRYFKPRTWRVVR